MLTSKQNSEWCLLLDLICSWFVPVGAGGKNVSTVSTAGRNINIAWSRDGEFVAVGCTSATKVRCAVVLASPCVLQPLRTPSVQDEIVNIINFRAGAIMKHIKFTYEVNGMSWDTHNNLWLCTGQKGCVGADELLSCSTVQLERGV